MNDKLYMCQVFIPENLTINMLLNLYPAERTIIENKCTPIDQITITSIRLMSPAISPIKHIEQNRCKKTNTDPFQSDETIII